MNKENFLKYAKSLATCQENGAKLDDLLGCDVSCEGFIGDLINGYGDIILDAVVGDKMIPDRLFERFWNCVCRGTKTADEEFIEIYEELIAL